jgi:hypothetical protein
MKKPAAEPAALSPPLWTPLRRVTKKSGSPVKASAPVSSMSPAASKSKTFKGPASKNTDKFSPVKMFVTCATAKSYICFVPQNEAGAKKTLLVNVTDKQSAQHKDVIKLMHKELQNHNLAAMDKTSAKQFAMNLRDALMS